MTNILIALAAGCAAALMFASIISGMLVSLVLVYFAPLPLMIAAMGWGPAAALIGGVGAGAVLTFSVSLTFGIGFVLSVVAPALWLGHLSLLARPAAATPAVDGSGAPLDWYPIGRVVAWAAILSTLLTLLAFLIVFGSSIDDVNGKLQELALRSFELNPAGAKIENKARAAQIMAQALPPVLVWATFLMYLLNLYVAGRVVRASGRLRRPWPMLHDIDLPQTAILVLAAALLLSFVGGLLALTAKMISAALLTAYTLVGFAVLHAVTQSPSGFWWRLAAYAALVMFVWPLLLVPMVGLLDGSLGLRRRFGGSARPPPNPST